MNKLAILNLVLCLSILSCVPTQYSELGTTDLDFHDNSRYPNSKRFFNQSVTSHRLKIGDRHYIKNVFKSVFGESHYNRNNYVKYNIHQNQGVFGGPCDRYEQARKGLDTTSYVDDNTRCFENNWNTDMTLESSTLREGWRVKVCELIIETNSYGTDHAFSKAEVNKDNDPTYDDLNRLYQLFYPIEDLPQESAKILIDGHPEFPDNEEFWKSSLLTFCVSTGWQNP